MSLQANWSYPTAIRFGAGRIGELKEACAEAGIARPLLVTDRGLAALPLVQGVLERVLEEISFQTDLGRVTITKEYVEERLSSVMGSEDLSRYIL